MNETEMVEITRQMLNSGKSRNGAWSRAQTEALGLSWPLQQGWPKLLIGRQITAAAAEKFLSLRDQHLHGKVEKVQKSKAMSCTLVDWLDENESHIHFKRSVTGQNMRLWSDATGDQVLAPTLRECVEKMIVLLDGSDKARSLVDKKNKETLDVQSRARELRIERDKPPH